MYKRIRVQHGCMYVTSCSTFADHDRRMSCVNDWYTRLLLSCRCQTTLCLKNCTLSVFAITVKCQPISVIFGTLHSDT